MATVLRLGKVLDMAATGRLAAELAARPEPVLLDASEVAHVGGLAAQLLLAARHSGGIAGAGMSVVAPSTGFAEGMRRLGIDPDLFSPGPGAAS